LLHTAWPIMKARLPWHRSWAEPIMRESSLRAPQY